MNIGTLISLWGTRLAEVVLVWGLIGASSSIAMDLFASRSHPDQIPPTLALRTLFVSGL